MDFSVRTKGKGPPVPEMKISRDLSRERFTGPPKGTSVTFEGVLVSDVDFRSVSFAEFRAQGTTFERCDFGGVRFAVGFTSYLGVGPVARFLDCTFTGADLRHTDPGLSRFERCTFDRAKIHDWQSDAGEFVDCRFATRITRSSFSGRPHGYWAEQLGKLRRVNEFHGNDFSGADLIDVSFKYGIDISAQRWPDDASYIRLDRLRERMRRVFEVVADWPVGHEREDALLLLRIYSTGGFEEQTELIARRDDLARSLASADRVWELLESAI